MAPSSIWFMPATGGQQLYWLTATYDPGNVSTFASDEELLLFEPYLEMMVAQD